MRILNFDVDGTLFNSMPSYGELFSGILFKEYGIPKDESVTSYFNSTGTNLPDQFEMMLKKHGKPADRIQEHVDEFFKVVDENPQKFKSFDDVVPALEQLKEYPKIMSTNTRQHILDRRVNYFGLAKYFDYVWGTVSPKQEGFKSKEEHWEALKTAYNLDDRKFREQVVLIDDGIPGMQKAKKLGIIAIGRAGTVTAEELERAGAYRTIKSLLELPEILKNL